MKHFPEIHTAEQMMAFIQQIGFLPLLDSGIPGYSAEEIVDADCRYVTYPDGGWDWPMWKWKGPIVTQRDCVYGKFFCSHAGYVSLAWWPDFLNWRRSLCPYPAEGSIEGIILSTLCETGSLITRELRAACGFNGPKMRGKFDSYVTRLEMGGYIVTEDFVYPHDRHNRPYGWGWSLLNTPESLFGKALCQPPLNADGTVRTPQQSYDRIFAHLSGLLISPADTPEAQDRLRKQIAKLICTRNS